MAFNYLTGTNLIKPKNPFNPNFSPEQLAQTSRMVEKDAGKGMEIAPNTTQMYNNYCQMLDQGIYQYHTRGEILNTQTFRTLDKLERNSSIYASLTNFKLSVIEPRMILKPANDSYEAGYAKDFMEHVLSEMDNCTIDDCALDLLSAILPGYSISEIIYKWIEYEKPFSRAKKPRKLTYKGLSAVKNKKAGLYGFDVDNWDNIEAVVFLNYQNIALPPEKFVIYSWLKKYGNPYGFGLFDVLFPLFYAINELQKFMVLGASKSASPTTVVYLPSGLPSSELSQIQSFVSKIDRSPAHTLPDKVRAEVLNTAKNNSSNPYIPVLQYLISEIEKVILLNDLTVSQSRGGGTRAETQAKIDSGKTPLIKYVRRSLEDTLNKQLLNRLLADNLDPLDFPKSCYPTLRFNDEDKEDKTPFVAMVATLTDLGYMSAMSKTDRQWVRDSVEAPKEEESNQNTDTVEFNPVTLDETAQQTDVTKEIEQLKQDNNSNEKYIVNYELDNLDSIETDKNEEDKVKIFDYAFDE